MENVLKWLIVSISGVKEFDLETKEDGNFTHFLIKTDKDNVGKIIGNKGRVINTIRNLTKIKAVLEKKSFRLDVEANN